MNTLGTTGAGTAVFDRELDLEHLMSATVESRRPTRASLPLRTDHELLFPIYDKLADIEPFLSMRLPFDISWYWTNDLDSKLLPTVYQYLRGHVSSIEQVL
jgi:hypothetical protein